MAADPRLGVDWMTPFYPWPGDEISGSFHRTQAQALNRAGVRVRVVAPRPAVPPLAGRLSQRWAGYAAMPVRQDDDGVEVLRPSYAAVPGEPAWAFPPAAIARAARRVFRHGEAPLLHAHFVAPTAMAARRVASGRRPYVITVHGYDATSWPETHPRQLDDYRGTLREAARVVTVSEALAARIAGWSGVEATPIPLGVDHRALRANVPSRSGARAALDLPDDRVLVLFAARLVPHKGIVAFVDAILSLGPEYLGVVIGDGPLSGYREEEGRAAGLLTYRGPQSRADVVTYMAAASMLVLPSSQEGLPTVVVEAGSLGLPVVASAVDGTPELLRDNRGILLDEVSPLTIAEGIRAVAADPTAAAHRASRLRELVERDYDVDRNAIRLVELYRHVLAEGPG
ncbi:MAG TPA: glycosyltransferase [Candidatus Limnocylindrales bacterium]